MGRAGVTLLLAGAQVLASAAGAQDLQQVVIQSRFVRLGTVPVSPGPWQFEVAITAAPNTVTDIEMTLPAGSTVLLVSESTDGSEWFHIDEGFLGVEALREAYPTGTYSFEINGGADSVALTYDPPAPPPSPNLTFPLHGATDVPFQDLTVTWDRCAGCSDAIVVSIIDPVAEEDVFFEILDPNAASWTLPGPLEPNTAYDGEVGTSRRPPAPRSS